MMTVMITSSCLQHDFNVFIEHRVWCNDWLHHRLYQSVPYIVGTTSLWFPYSFLMFYNIMNICLLYVSLMVNRYIHSWILMLYQLIISYLLSQVFALVVTWAKLKIVIMTTLYNNMFILMCQSSDYISKEW